MSDFVPKVKAREGMDPNPISAFSRALFIVKDEPTLQKYMDIFDQEYLDYSSRANLQNVFLFSGSLLDSIIVREEKKYLKYNEFRENVEKDITFNLNNYRLSLEIMLDIVQTLLPRERKKGFEMHDYLEDAVNVAKTHLDKLYKEFLRSL